MDPTSVKNVKQGARRWLSRRSVLQASAAGAPHGERPSESITTEQTAVAEWPECQVTE
jgi:hypothetical protein